ncbi:unnamed protein product [Leuciscus chuanchicus]
MSNSCLLRLFGRSSRWIDYSLSSRPNGVIVAGKAYSTALLHICRIQTVNFSALFSSIALSRPQAAILQRWKSTVVNTLLSHTVNGVKVHSRAPQTPYTCHYFHTATSNEVEPSVIPEDTSPCLHSGPLIFLLSETKHSESLLRPALRAP